LNTSRDGDSTSSLGSLFQCLTELQLVTGEDSQGTKREKKMGLEQRCLLTPYTSSQLQDVKPAESIQKSMYCLEKASLLNTANPTS